MAVKMRCQEVKKLLETMPKGGCEQTLHRVSDHLSECEACREICASWQKMEEVLIGSKLWLDKIALPTPMSETPILAQTVPQPSRQLLRLRPALAGAVVLLLAIASASALFLRGRDTKGRDGPGIPMTPKEMAAATSSQTLRELAEVLRRHETPSLELPYGPAAFTYEPFVPATLRQYTLEPEDTLRTIAVSKLNLTRREEL